MWKRLPSKLSRNSGVSLIEMIMTIVVVGIVSVPLAVFLERHVTSTFQMVDTNRALNLARYDIEVIKRLDYNTVTSATLLNYQSSGYDIVRTVTFAAGSGASAESLKQVSIRARRTGTTKILIDIYTLLARNVTVGS